MKATALILAVAMGGFPTARAEWRFETLTTLSGYTATNVVIKRVEGAYAVVFYPGGITRVPTHDLPDAVLSTIGLSTRAQVEANREAATAATEAKRQAEEAAAAASAAIDARERKRAERQRDEEQQRLSSGLIQDAETATMEQVALFPERYIGKRLVFQNCEVSLALEKSELPDLFGMELRSRGGEFFFGRLSPQSKGITFLVGTNIAEQMSPHLAGGMRWPNCTIEADIQEATHRSAKHTIGVVSRINVFNMGGKVGSVLVEQNPAK